MHSLWLEAVLIGNIVDGILLTIGGYPLDLATNCKSSMIGSGVFQFRLFLSVNSITGLVTVIVVDRMSDETFSKFIFSMKVIN